MLRICETKNKMIAFSVRPASKYVHLDNLLFDLKYDPTVVEIPVPRYFKDETDNIDIDLIWKELRPQRPGEKKPKPPKKTKKNKKKDKKPKAWWEVDEKKEEEESIVVKEKWIDEAQLKQFNTNEPHQERVIDFLDNSNMSLVEAIRVIQKNERGRQSRSRYQNFVADLAKQANEARRKEALRAGGVVANKQE